MNFRKPQFRRGFTLIELLVVIMIIALLASITLFTLQGVQESARDARTRAQIARLHDLIMARMEEFKTRPMPIKIPAGTDAATAARLRVDAVRAMMRLELPDRRTDVYVPNTSGPNFVPAAYDMAPALSWPAVAKQYWTKAMGSRNVPGNTSWTEEHESAECLYLIVASIHDGDSSALEFFSESEIGDVDGDGMFEILDAWGNPIHFLRWAPGFGADFTSHPTHPPIPFFASTLQPLSDRDPNNVGAVDPFDPLRVYGKNFPLYPLIFSAGTDEVYGIVTVAPAIGPSGEFIYWNTTPPNNPYYLPPAPDYPMGTPLPDANGNLGYADNIYNHFRNVR